MPPILLVRILPKRPCQIELYRFLQLSALGHRTNPLAGEFAAAQAVPWG